MTHSNWLRLCWAALTALAVSGTAHGLRLDLAGGISAEHSSNVLRTEHDTEQETIGIVWGGVSAREDAANLTAELAAVVESRQYFNDVIGDELLLSLASQVDWMMLPQRLNWHFEDYFQQTATNPLATYSPANQQDTNVLWTGPDLHFRFAQLYSLQLGARYGNFYYEKTRGDNDRLAGFARAIRRLSADSELYLQADRMRTEYDDAGRLDIYDVVIRDFDRSDAFLGYRWQSVLTELELEGGYTWIRRDGGADIDRPYMRLSLHRRLAGDGGAGLRLSSQLTESSAGLLESGGGRSRLDPHNNEISQDIVRERYGELFYYRRWWAVETDLRLFWRDEDYQEAIYGERAAGLGVDIVYPLSPVWAARMFGTYVHADRHRIDRKDRRAVAGIGAAHRLSHRISIDFQLRDEWQDSTEAGWDFNELIALIELRYGERPSWAPSR